jgi:hypothetical protein
MLLSIAAVANAKSIGSAKVALNVFREHSEALKENNISKGFLDRALAEARRLLTRIEAALNPVRRECRIEVERTLVAAFSDLRGSVSSLGDRMTDLQLRFVSGESAYKAFMTGSRAIWREQRRTIRRLQSIADSAVDKLSTRYPKLSRRLLARRTRASATSRLSLARGLVCLTRRSPR